MRGASRWAAGLSACVALAAATARAQSIEEVAPPPHHWFALDLDFGGGIDVDTSNRGVSGIYLQRLRVGWSYVRAWKFWNVVATAETYNFHRFAFGAQAEVVSLGNGLGAYLGPTVSTGGVVGATVGVGWSLLYVESQVHFGSPIDVAVTALLRIPIGGLTYARFGPKRGFTLPSPIPVRPRAPSAPPPASPPAPAPATPAEPATPSPPTPSPPTPSPPTPSPPTPSPLTPLPPPSPAPVQQ